MAAMSPMWVFGYGSLIWNPGFAYDARLVGFVRDYRRVFYQGNPPHPPATAAQSLISSRPALSFSRFSLAAGQGARTTGARRSSPEGPSRSSTSLGLLALSTLFAVRALVLRLNSSILHLQWGIAYKISREEDKQVALEYLEVREKQYDEKIYLDLYTDSSPKTPAVQNVMVYLATASNESNQNYLGPAPLEEMAKQIYLAEGPTGPNKEYLFKLEDALNKLGVVDPHVQELANAVREYSGTELSH